MSTEEYLNELTGPLIRSFIWNNKTFYVVSAECTIADTAKLMTEIIHQAVKDFERLALPSARKDKASRENWTTARGLLFEDDYTIDYGDIPVTFKDILEFISTDGSFSVSSMRKSLITQTFGYWKIKGEQLEEEFWKQEQQKQ